MRDLYEEPWWLDALAAGDATSWWRKVYFSHNYQLTGIEAYADMYELTGERRYIDAVLATWAMVRDPLHGWIHVGGSLAINEGGIYTPGSFHLDAGAVPGERLRHRDESREERGRAAGEAYSHRHPHQSTTPGGGRSLQTEWGSFPTGEFCGAVFWLKLNQRLHRFFPNNVSYVDEIEREIFNEGLVHLGPLHDDGTGVGIRYFSNLNGEKEPAAADGTCCEVSENESPLGFCDNVGLLLLWFRDGFMRASVNFHVPFVSHLPK